MSVRAANRRNNMRLNVDVSLCPSTFLRKLALATGRPGADLGYTEGGQFKPGEREFPSTLDPAGFAIDYLWSVLLSKFDDGKSSERKTEAALRSFRDAEVQCGETNIRLSRMVGLPSDLAVTDIERCMCIARRKVRGILGSFSWNHAARLMGFSTGASVSLPRKRSSIVHKYSGIPETTFANADLARCCISQREPWYRALLSEQGTIDLKLVKGNRVTTVPKNFKKDRVIAIEPRMNMFVQRGIGGLIRARLMRNAGINLNDQSVNQGLAFLGSVSGRLATVDLSAASDSVSLGLTEFLLPAPWLEAIKLTRSEQGVLPSGDEVYYRKVSSMGNGYTFELESLFFYSLAWACCDLLGIDNSFTSIYGDDIIIDVDAVPLLQDVMSYCGFTFNADKSHWSGPFRESCGEHYFHGRSCTPFFIRRPINTLEDLFKLHNQLYRWFTAQSGNPDLCVEACRDLLEWVRLQAPARWVRPRIPDGYGDGAFIGTFDQCTPTPASDFKQGKRFPYAGWEGYVAEVLGTVTSYADFHELPSDPEMNLTIYGSRGYDRKVKPLDPQGANEVGRLMQSLSSVGLDDAWGGVPLPPRRRLIKIVVDGFAPDPLNL